MLAYVLGYSVVLVDSGWSLRNRMSSGEQYKICSIYGNGKMEFLGLLAFLTMQLDVWTDTRADGQKN